MRPLRGRNACGASIPVVAPQPPANGLHPSGMGERGGVLAISSGMGDPGGVRAISSGMSDPGGVGAISPGSRSVTRGKGSRHANRPRRGHSAPGCADRSIDGPARVESEPRCDPSGVGTRVGTRYRWWLRNHRLMACIPPGWVTPEGSEPLAPGWVTPEGSEPLAPGWVTPEGSEPLAPGRGA